MNEWILYVYVWFDNIFFIGVNSFACYRLIIEKRSTLGSEFINS